MPTAAQEQQMLAHWQAVVPNAAFDYAYAWGSQNGDVALESSPELQNVFLQHNTSGSAEVVDPPITPPVTDTGSTPDVPDTGVTTPPATDTGGTTPPATGGGTTTGSPSAGGSPSDPTTPPTTEAGGGWHNHHHGLDFSQWVGRGSSSWGGHSRDAVTAVATTETVTTAPEATSGSPADAIQWHNFDLSSHSDHHHGWLW